MLIYKFGGASVKDAGGVKILKGIIDNCHQQLVVVVSAMGKTTNALETIVENYFAATDYLPLVSVLKAFHTDLISKLFGNGATSPTFEEMWKKTISYVEANEKETKKTKCFHERRIQKANCKRKEMKRSKGDCSDSDW